MPLGWALLWGLAKKYWLVLLLISVVIGGYFWVRHTAVKEERNKILVEQVKETTKREKKKEEVREKTNELRKKIDSRRRTYPIDDEFNSCVLSSDPIKTKCP